MAGSYIKSIADYIDYVSELSAKFDKSELWFRGHSDRSFKAEPSVLRTPDWKAREQEMLNQLLAERPASFDADVNSFERLARAQHYGLPTRLLDVTSNPLVALYFATEPSTEGEQSSRRTTKRKAGEIIVFRVKKGQRRFYSDRVVELLSSLTFVEHSDKKMLRNAYLEAREKAQVEYPEDPEKFVSEIKNGFYKSPLVCAFLGRNPEVAKLWDEAHPDFLAEIVTVQPRRIDKRIEAQSGAFMLFGLFSPESEKRERFFLKDLVREEVYISPRDKAPLRKQLAVIGVEERHLFPSLELSAKEIKEGRP